MVRTKFKMDFQQRNFEILVESLAYFDSQEKFDTIKHVLGTSFLYLLADHLLAYEKQK